jgi:hypothetical protein
MFYLLGTLDGDNEKEVETAGPGIRKGRQCKREREKKIILEHGKQINTAY